MAAMIGALTNAVLATARLRMFKQNTFLLIGLLIVGGVLLVLILVGWTGVKALLWRRGKAKSDQEFRAQKLRPDGQPYPPAAPGVCDHCGVAFGKVYYLPDGQKQCPKCYG